jgi:archaellum component FlaF (FlaF/FlaG flagellin family)
MRWRSNIRNKMISIKKNRKGAIELSVSTIVIVVIAMAMLILGLVLVRTIFKSTISSIDKVDEGVKKEINNLFSDGNQKVVVRLTNSKLDVKQGEIFGFAFGIKNTVQGESTAGKFSYEIKSSSIQRGCQLTQTQADNYIILGDKGTFDLPPGQIYTGFVEVQPSSNSPLCDIRYDISVTKDSQPYDSSFFIARVVS